MKLTVLAQNTYLSMLTPIPMVSETILSSKTPREREQREREREQRESEQRDRESEQRDRDSGEIEIVSGEIERVERERAERVQPWSHGGQDGS